MSTSFRIQRAKVKFHFGHPASQIRFWRGLVERALRSHETPFYLFSIEPIREALSDLSVLEASVPVRHWLSCKTQPVRALLQWWRRQGRGIEVVSEYELCAALAEGFPPEHILVNGPAKHTWLRRPARRGLRVNFDSLAEIDVLLPLAREGDWSVGIRFHTREEHDPGAPVWPTQFGLLREEAATAIRLLQRAGVRLETAHFHLRTNVASPEIYRRAANEVAEVCRATGFQPKHLDLGGGLPPPHVLSSDGQRYDAAFKLADLARVYREVAGQFLGLRELWLENGRFISARSGVLVLRVRDVKERGGLRQLICDGGRTTHALVSNWEAHAIITIPRRTGRAVPTAVYGATCMAFDQLACRPMPRSLRVGDCLVWLEAGAYHIPWETRFSQGWAKVLWHERDRLWVAREAESFASWWGQWK